MPDHPVFWIVLCAILSLGLVWFQYFFRPGPTRFRYFLAALRFFAVLGLLVLLINPKIRETRVFLEKHRLVLLLDNSASIRTDSSRQALYNLRSLFGRDPEIADRFDRDLFTFGDAMSLSDSLDFTAGRTNIGSALDRATQAINSDHAVILIATDGNENSGRSYLQAAGTGIPVYPIVIGDTTR